MGLWRSQFRRSVLHIRGSPWSPRRPPSVSQPPSTCAETRTPDVVMSASRHLASVKKKRPESRLAVIVVFDGSLQGRFTEGSRRGCRRDETPERTSLGIFLRDPHACVITCNCHSSRPPPFPQFCSPPKTKPCAMADQNDDKREMRIMWIASAVTVLVILGAMGINMLMHHDTNAATPETTQSPPK